MHLKHVKARSMLASQNLTIPTAANAGNRCLRKFKAKLSPRASGSIEKQENFCFAQRKSFVAEEHFHFLPSC